MAPDAIDLVMLARGRQPPRRSPEFRYAELGCGRGVTLSTLAAGYPEAEFFGFDFLPEHIAWARSLAREAGLDNVTFEEADFATLATADQKPARFDYVALHGVYAWISAQNRAHIVDILERWVEPGGAVYIGCNAKPGWAAGEPIRRIVRDVLDSGKASEAGLSGARAAVELWLGQSGSKASQAVWDRLSSLSDDYLLHELGAVDGGALWTTELASHLAAAKLERIGSVALAENFDLLTLNDEARKFVQEADAAGFGLTGRDLVSRRAFISDVFSRGAPALSRAAIERILGQVCVAAVEPVLAFEKQKVPEREQRALSASIRKKLEKLLTFEPRPISEVIAKTDLEPRQTAQAVLILIASGGARTLRPAELAERATLGCDRFNNVARQRHEDGQPLPGVAAPLLGCGVPLTQQEKEVAFAGTDTELSKALARIGIGTLAPEL